MHLPFVCVYASPPDLLGFLGLGERPGRETGGSLGFSSELTCSGRLLGLCREGLSSRAGQGISGLWAAVSWRRGYPEANLAICLGGWYPTPIRALWVAQYCCGKSEGRKTISGREDRDQPV